MRLAGFFVFLAIGLGVVANGQTVPLAGPSEMQECSRPTCLPQIEFRRQETALWCWAAVGEMIMDPVKDVEQCEQANRRFRRTDCCRRPVPRRCRRGGFPEFARFGFAFQRTASGALSWEAIKNEIARNRPIAFSWRWYGLATSGHIMVIVGYIETELDREVKVYDPNSDGEMITYSYDYYVRHYPHHSHWDDFYAIRKAK